eukprot:TRINITY_DN1291_c0_g1_i1.p2 TRINITY_DN1291_c0_g1~~TRINITY_DN1291_c0_g1_i1.p2  ORF type:complete len:163 (-),score=7.71 TRINITY_DN1291_c0_g1_i1:1176-1664(-)
MRRLYDWALPFTVPQLGTFEIAANNFGWLRRPWLDAVILPRQQASDFSVPFAKDADMKDYLENLVATASEPEHEMEEKLPPRWVRLTSPFRTPSHPAARRRTYDARPLVWRDLLAPAWCSGATQAPHFFALTRWFPACPLWYVDHGVYTESPYAVSYLAHHL